MARNERQKPSTLLSKQAHGVRPAEEQPPGAGQRAQDLLAIHQAARLAGSEERVEEGAVDRRKLGEVGERHALVDLVHGVADEAELDHRADALEEARIRGAAAGRWRREDAGDRADCPRQAVDQRPRRGQEGFAGARFDGQPHRRLAGGVGERRVDLGGEVRRQRLDRPAVVEAHVEARLRFRRNHVEGGVAHVDAGDLQVGGLEILVAGVELEPREPVERRGRAAAAGSRPDADRRRGPAARSP